MKSNSLRIVVGTFLLLASVSGAHAQDRWPLRFTGLINDYSPSTVKGGPWEMHGQWTLDLKEERRGEHLTADFIADMTMSDYGTTNGAADATKGGQSPHTHHIKISHATITWNMDGCPVFSPATKSGFQINETVSILTGNGSNALFEPAPPETKLQVCISGGDETPGSVPFSNMTMVFVGPATAHFGTQAIHGVVRKAASEGVRRSW